MLIVVNGTLMRGLELNTNMIAAGSTFVADAVTAPCYRLWSIDDRYPGMVRVAAGGTSVAVELWELTAPGLVQILEGEPPGLSIGRVLMADDREILGVLAEPYATEGQPEISRFGGWRAYIASRSTAMLTGE